MAKKNQDTSNGAKESSSDKSPYAVKEARRKVFARIRTDWEFEYPLDDERLSKDIVLSSTSEGRPQTEKAGPNTLDPEADSSSLGSTTDVTTQPFNEDLRVLEWRERTYASSDPSTSEEDESGADEAVHYTSKKQALQGQRTRSTSGIVQDETTRQLQRDQRRQRRHNRLEAEMAWNPGLRYFQARRDAWCCAKKTSEFTNTTPDASSDSQDLATANVDTSTSRNASSTSAQDKEAMSTPASSELESMSTTPPTSASASLTDTTTAANNQAPQNSYTPTLIPVHSSLLRSSDPSRAIITPNLYPSIYAKVVMQSLSPSVPINLSHMVPALVTGWRASDAWPPKSTASPQTPTTSAHLPSSATIVSSALNGLGIGGKMRGWRNKLSSNNTATQAQSNNGRSNSNAGSSIPSMDGAADNKEKSKHKKKLQQREKEREKERELEERSQHRRPSTIPAGADGTANDDPQNGAVQRKETPPLLDTKNIANPTSPTSVDTNRSAGSSAKPQITSPIRKGVNRVGKVLRLSWAGSGSGGTPNGNANGSVSSSSPSPAPVSANAAHDAT